MQMRLGIVAVCVLAVALAGCGKKGGQKQSPQPTQAPAPAATAAAPSAPDMAKVAEQNRQALTQMNQGKTIEAMPAATLKALLPADLPGMKRTNASAERNQAMGIDISTAEGQYEATDGQGANVSLRLTDVSSMSGPMRMSMAGWAMAEFSRETDTGYEKTTTFSGHKAFEEYNTADKRGTVRVFVVERFIVEIEGEGITMDALKQMLGKVDLKKLAAAGS
jgi:hypothetical protein